jgi:hypothetical protein
MTKEKKPNKLSIPEILNILQERYNHNREKRIERYLQNQRKNNQKETPINYEEELNRHRENQKIAEQMEEDYLKEMKKKKDNDEL